MWRRFRAYIVAGIAVLLPIVATYVSLHWLFNTVDRLIYRFIPQEYHGLLRPGMGALVSLLLVLLAGVLVTHLGGRRLVQAGENLLARLPLVRSVYGTAKSITDALFGTNRQAFQKAALIQFPRPGIFTLGFITGKVGSMYSLFIPTTPNPTSGWFIMAPANEVAPLQVPVEVILRLIISGGVIEPDSLVADFLNSAAAKLTQEKREAPSG